MQGSKVAVEEGSSEETRNLDASLELEVIEDDEGIPYSYILECKKVIDELEPRLQADIYTGILLEVVQRILSDIQTNLLQVEDVTSSNMMLAHAHYVYVLKEFLPDRKPLRRNQNVGSRR